MKEDGKITLLLLCKQLLKIRWNSVIKIIPWFPLIHSLIYLLVILNLNLASLKAKSQKDFPNLFFPLELKSESLTLIFLGQLAIFYEPSPHGY